jgi:glycosyltransferase involved in cell wall biosynthesis
MPDTRPPSSRDETDVVDVVLPTHRRPHTLPFAIESVLAQTYPHLRLHVISDGLDPATEAVVSSFGDPRLHFSAFPKGPGFGYANRNVVMRGLTGRWVAYMNDDDLLFADHLATAVDALRAGPELVALRPCAVHFPDTVDPHFFAFSWRGPLGTRFLRHWFMGSVNCVHERRLFERVGGWNEALSRFGDREFYNRARRGARSHYLDRITILRFYALHWDRRYGRVGEPPQVRYVRLVRDPEWMEAVRRAAAAVPSWDSRRRQLGDVLAFGLRSGPRFLRFGWELLGPGSGRGRRAPARPVDA